MRWHQRPLRVSLMGLCSWEAPLSQWPWSGFKKALVWAWGYRWTDPSRSRAHVSGLHAGRRESTGLRLPRSLPTTKRAIREVTVATNTSARVTRTSLGALGAMGATAEESKPVGKTPVSRKECAMWARQSQPLGLNLLTCLTEMRTPTTLITKKRSGTL